jgi:hypothetical protein
MENKNYKNTFLKSLLFIAISSLIVLGSFEQSVSEEKAIYYYRDMVNPDVYIYFEKNLEIEEVDDGRITIWGSDRVKRNGLLSDGGGYIIDCSTNELDFCIDWAGVLRFSYPCAMLDGGKSQWQSDGWQFRLSSGEGSQSEYLITGRKEKYIDKYEDGWDESYEAQFILSETKGITEIFIIKLDEEYQRREPLYQASIASVWRSLDKGFGQIDKVCN